MYFGSLFDSYHFPSVCGLGQTDWAVGTVSKLFDHRVMLHFTSTYQESLLKGEP